MIEEQELRERLKVVDVPPTGLTTTQLVKAGRRRATRRRTLRTGCGVALAVVLAFAGQSVVARAGGRPADSAAGQPGRLVRCDATRLAVPAGLKEVQAEAIDPSGRYVVGNAITRRGAFTVAKGEDLDIQPILWTDGQPQVMTMVGASVRASAVDARGTVVAVAGQSDSRGRWESVLRYAGGVPEKLNPPAGSWIFNAIPKIDASGTVLAIAYRRNKVHDPVVLTWKAGTTTATVLPMPAGIDTINVTDAGTVIADVVSKTAGHTVYVWDQQGGRRQLAAPGGEGGYNFASRGDWVTANVGSSGTVARWNLRTGEIADTGVAAPANGVNALGWILAGESVRRDDATVTLVAPAGLTGTPVSVSDTGIVIGSVYDFGSPGASASPGSADGGPYAWQCKR